jgi:uncharacterized protein (TIGR03086 family)
MDARETIALLPEAARAVSAVVDRIGEDAWSRPTPCEGWDVRDLLNHLTYEHLWAPHLLRGETLEEVGDRYDGDVLGEDPRGTWRRTIAASMLAWGSADPERRVHTSMGLIPVGVYATQMLADLTVHGWDLAKGAGTAYEPVPDAVEAVWAAYRPRHRDGQPIAPVFAAPVPTDSEDRLDQLVALLGRRPDWTAA